MTVDWLDRLFQSEEQGTTATIERPEATTREQQARPYTSVEIPNKTRYDSIIDTVAREYPDISPDIVKKLINRESSSDPLATIETGKYGKARGLGQFIDSTAKNYIPGWQTPQDSYDPKKNIRGIFAYLSDLKRQEGGDIRSALIRYHGGTIDRLGTRSTDYADEIITGKRIGQPTPQEKYVPQDKNWLDKLFHPDIPMRMAEEKQPLAEPEAEDISIEKFTPEERRQMFSVVGGKKIPETTGVTEQPITINTEEFKKLPPEELKQIFSVAKDEAEKVTPEQRTAEAFSRARDRVSRARWYLSLSPDKQAEIRADMTPEQQQALDEGLAGIKSEATGEAFGMGGVMATPLKYAAPKDSRQYAESAMQLNPEAAMAGAVTSNIVQALAAAGPIGKALSKVPAIAKSPVLSATLQRMVTSGAISAGQQEWKESFRESLLNVGESMLAGGFSVVPEVAIPAEGKKILLQLAAQPLSDVVFNIASGKIRGRTAEETMKQALIDAAMGAGFAIRDVQSGMVFQDIQAAQRGEVKNWFKRRPGIKIEIIEPKGGEYARTGGEEIRATSPEEGIEGGGERQIRLRDDAEKVRMEAEKGAEPGERQIRPEQATEQLRPIERRKDIVRRKAIEEMTPEEAKKALTYDELTGLKTRRAWEDVTKKPVQGILDADGLKWLNDNLDYESGDILLKEIGKALNEAGMDAYRTGGDEIRFQADSEKELEKIIEKAYNILDDKTIDVQLPSGEIVSYKGLGFSYGISKHSNPTEAAKAAETNLHKSKAERARTGKRAARGEQPPGVVRKTSQREQGAAGEVDFKPTHEEEVSPEARPNELAEPDVKQQVEQEIEEMARIQSRSDVSEAIENPLPKRKRGLLSVQGSLGTENQIKITDEAEQSFDAIDKEIRKKFVPDFKTLMTAVKNKAGQLIFDSNFVIKSLVEGDPQAEKFMTEFIALKGANGEVKLNITELEKRATEYLPHKYEKLLSRYRTAKRIVEIEEFYKHDLTKSFKHPMGLTYEKAKSYVDKVESDKTAWPIIKKATSVINNGYQSLLKYAHDEELLTDEAFKNLSQYHYYEPRIFLQHIDPAYSAGKKSVSESGFQALKEGSEEAMMVNWRYGYAEQAKRIIKRVYNNRAARELYNYVKNNPENPLGAKIDELASGEKVKTLPKTPPGYERINTLIKGEKHSVLLPKDIADSYNGAGAIHNTFVANVLRGLSLSGITRMTATGIAAPEYSIANIAMDMFYTFLRFDKGYSPILPVYVGQKLKDMFRVQGDSFKATGDWKDFVKEGGSMEFLYEQGKMWKRDPTKPKSQMSESSDQLYDGMTIFQSSSERMGRLSTRKRLIDAGYTPKQASIMVRDGLDFSQGGDLIKLMDNVFPYLNSGTQAARGLWKAAKTNPKIFTFKVAQLMATGAAAAVLNKLIDRDGNNKVSEREKVNNYVVNLPLKYKDKNDEDRHVYLRMRKDQGQRVFATAGEVLVDRAFGDITGEQAWKRIRMALADLSPTMIADLDIPSIAFFKAYINNKDFWMNEDIWKGRENISPYLERYPNYTPKALIDLTEQLHKVGVEVSPHRLSVASREIMAPNIVSGSFNYLYENITDKLEGKEKEKLDKKVYENLTALPGVRKIIRKTRPQIYQRDKIKAKAEKYGIATEGKPLGKLKVEVTKFDRRLMDIRQENDEQLYQLLKSNPSTEQINEFMDNAADKYTGDLIRFQGKEIRRLFRKLRREINESRND